MIVRFKIDEKVIIKNRNPRLDSNGVVTFITTPKGASYPIYSIRRRLVFDVQCFGSTIALDNQQVCKYARACPAFRIFKLKEM